MEKVFCTACRITLTSHEDSRTHYKSEFHTYNLKRKHVGLDPLSQEKYEQKMQESFILLNPGTKILKCDCCNQIFSTEKQLQRHKNSKKVLSDTISTDPLLACLFCSNQSENIEKNLNHMTVSHGFFIPNIELVKNFEELLKYLQSKVRDLLMCLYCNNRQGHCFKSPAAVQQHMRDKQHCFMGIEDVEEFRQFYLEAEDRSFEVISSSDEANLEHYVDLGSQSSETYSFSFLSSNHSRLHGEVTAFGELRLENGKILGSKEYLRYYKQYFRPIPARMQELLAIVEENQTSKDTAEPERDYGFCGNNAQGELLRQGMKNNMLQHYFRSQV